MQIVAELGMVVTAEVSHPPVATLTDEEKKHLGITTADPSSLTNLIQE